MSENSKSRWRWPIIIGSATAIVVYLILGLLLDVVEKKNEGRSTFMTVVELSEEIDDPAVWGKNFPDQYDAFMRTVDSERTRFGGSEALPREPTSDDPRTSVAPSKIEADPRLIRMWLGYAFSIDYREKRGHAYMLDDQTFTGRQSRPQPGTCMSCHASNVTAWRSLGDGDLESGAAKMFAMSYAEARTHVTQAISCIDCHDPKTMALRITRPAFAKGIRAYKASQGVDDYDVHTQATRHEMRTYVCAQCHVEYYFKGEERALTYPWDDGLRSDEILAYFDRNEFRDWTHETTGAAMLKPQHPEFELWSQGTHAAAGVSCVDCHMPYKRVGAAKITDHHIRSPLLNVNRACQTCHKVPEKELLSRVESIQQRTHEMVDTTLTALMNLIESIEQRKSSGATEGDLSDALTAQRRATWFVDFVEAENSSGFHAPQESARTLFRAMDEIRKGQIALESSNP